MPDHPQRFRYFLDYDEEHNALNIFAAVTNYGLFGENQTYWDSDDPEDLPITNTFTNPFEGYGATFPRDDSGVSWCGANRDALGPEVPEGVARKIHPTLFERKKRDEEREAQHP